MVIIMAITPSLKASNLPFPMVNHSVKKMKLNKKCTIQSNYYFCLVFGSFYCIASHSFNGMHCDRRIKRETGVIPVLSP